MKYIKVFSLFVLLHALAWGGADAYLKLNNEEILVVVDTSFSMKKKFPEIKQWVEDFENSARYKKIVIGTDKALLGELKSLRSKEEIFRTSFGIIKEDSLKRYNNNNSRKIFLSDGTIKPEGWELVEF